MSPVINTKYNNKKNKIAKFLKYDLHACISGVQTAPAESWPITVSYDPLQAKSLLLGVQVLMSDSSIM